MTLKVSRFARLRSGLSFCAALAAACSSSDTSAPMLPSPLVVISEIMYHPVDENAAADHHEFIELYNRADTAVDLSGWKLTGDVSYTFPNGASIAPHGYTVIAKNRAALAAVSSYQLKAADLFGEYTGELDNGSGAVTLVNSQSATIDSVTYSDQFPWPIGADALGANDDWLGMLPTPLTSAPHQYRGRSLERVSYEVPASEVSNWVPSPLDGASPGRANSLSGAPPAIVQTKTVSWSGSDVLIRAADSVKIAVTFSALGPFSSPQLEYFVDNLEVTGEPTIKVPMTLNNGAYEATLPPQPNNSIVRYRILASRGGASEVFSPRPSDPMPYWAYFVTPPVATTSPLYQLFIKKTNWNQLYDNLNFALDDRRVSPGGSATNRCQIRASWDSKVPAVFVYNGVVYDTFVRYEGSRWNRMNGVTLDATKTTINPLPDRPSAPYKVLSWKVNFPDYATLEGKRKKLVLNKLNQGCPGLDDTLGERLYGDPSINIPVQRTKYARFHVNGGYYHYMLDLEHIDADMLKRYRAANEPVGDLFKGDGNSGPTNIEGPWGMSDESVLTTNPSCPNWTLDDRYAYTYERFTNSWDNVTALRSMIESVNSLRQAAVASGNLTPLRDYLMANFDYQKVLDYIAIRNWAEPWDEAFHNHFLYRRATDGKWLLIPQDKDMEFGEFFGWGTGKSFYIGEEGNVDNRSGSWNRIKDAFIKAFRAELWSRIVQLDATGVLNPATYRSKVDQAAATFNATDYAASPAASSVCNFNTELGKLRQFGECRHNDVLDGIAASTCTATTCGLKAEYFQTLAGDLTHDFTKATLKLTRNDAMVNFDWGTSAPAAGLPTDSFQVRWSGKLTPRYTEAYTFYTQTDDGVRVFVNGTQVINKWMDMAATVENTGTINLTAGVPVTITVEYYDNITTASAKLSWSSASQCKQLIPQARFAPM